MPTLTQVCCELFSGESLVLMGVLLSLATHTEKDWGTKTGQKSSPHRSLQTQAPLLSSLFTDGSVSGGTDL